MSTKINKTTEIYQGRIFSLVKEDVTLENGADSSFDIIRHRGAAVMVPLVGEDVILIKQYRHSLGEHIWEIPAGTLEKEEEPLECAKRELIEEIGYNAQKWEKLGKITPLPAYSDEIIHIFLAQDMEAAEQKLDKDEILEVHKINFEKALSMIDSGEIYDSKTIAALLMTKRFLSK